jgi:hypothetical protein
MQRRAQQHSRHAEDHQRAKLLHRQAGAPEQAARQQTEDHRRQRRDEVQREVSAAVEHERPLAREQIQEPLIRDVGDVGVLVPVSREARQVMRPVQRDTDGGRVESRRRQGVQGERRPIPDQDHDRGGPLHCGLRPGQQKQKHVAQADLRQHVLEREVGLGPALRPEKDAERHQRDGANGRVPEQAREGLPFFAPARDGERQRDAHHEHEGRLNQIPGRAAHPLAMIEHARREPRDVAVGKPARDLRNPHDLRRHEQHREAAEHVEGEKTFHLFRGAPTGACSRSSTAPLTIAPSSEAK